MGDPAQTPPQAVSAPSRLARRGFLVGGVLMLGAGAFAGTRWFNVGADLSGGALSVQVAHEKAVAGDILLVDIRRPDEWARTGVGVGAQPLDMRRADFTEALLALTSGRADAPVALICARGVRSARLSRRLSDAGFSRIIDVPEGMLGSGAGPGWLKAGLPVRQPG
ncbi:MAG: rhodanese-like domain-containing protein [Pseudomonadota bacterium]